VDDQVVYGFVLGGPFVGGRGGVVGLREHGEDCVRVGEGEGFALVIATVLAVVSKRWRSREWWK
jgi:hypothetical protein